MKYNLPPNEFMILKDALVTHDYKMGHGFLTLTNLNLFYTTTEDYKGKNVIQYIYPVNQIKVYNWKAQVMVEGNHIDIFFINGQEEAFEFMEYSRREPFSMPSKNAFSAADLAEAINQLLLTEKVTKKCSYCGAQISGTAGQIVRCRYCDGDQQL